MTLLQILLAMLQPTDIPRPQFLPDNYKLAWNDEFDGRRLDARKWKTWIVGPRRKAINVEDAAKLDGQGNLLITTRTEGSGESKKYLSGGIWTDGIYEPTFGYFEIRLKWHSQEGHWGAFWLNCHRMGLPVGHPDAGGVEMDIVEFHQLLKGGTEVVQTIHWDGYGEHLKSKSTPVLGTPNDGKFHTYGLLWEPEGYQFFADGKPTWGWKAADGAPVSKRPQHIIVSMEVGDWGGDIARARLPDGIVVDYVRHWQRPRS